MIRDLLTPEAHQDGYVWAAVLLSHAFIGGVGVMFMGWWFLPVYLAFEVVQAVRARRALYWDSVLDIVAVVLGGFSVAIGSIGAALADPDRMPLWVRRGQVAPVSCWIGLLRPSWLGSAGTARWGRRAERHQT